MPKLTNLPSNPPAFILIGMTGSISCYKVCDLISRLKKLGHTVQVVLSESALQFIGPATIEGLTGLPVLTQNFHSQHMMDHIKLARKADVFLIAPATANCINKLSAGIADDLIGTLYLAYEKHKPLIIAPAMNGVMYEHDSVQKSLRVLLDRGHTIAGPAEGELACGEEGSGRLLEPKDLEAIIKESLSSKTSSESKLRVLITSGGTKEQIDSVRSITNFSTGKTGAAIAESLVKQNFDVTLLAAQGSALPACKVNLKEYVSFNDLKNELFDALKNDHYDYVIHAAAVSDYSVAKVRTPEVEVNHPAGTKISSNAPITLELKTTPKLVTFLKSASKNPKIKIVAFKLTDTYDVSEQQKAVTDLMASARADYVVHNDISDIKNKNYIFTLYKSDGHKYDCNGRDALSELLSKEVKNDIMP